eukprot:CAMPEP_0175873402 /NCGR_PEP_ID=MMETSP0107_2-20121207/38293_1 /TAXON_ID=195067 ORGANISM="Goniomonas pacifica, Strain CCMP1869" /NCGR_SAMPLE_ID=MMETSP0107_2 /ASSEMBLY_ACC=CAM_ASM_000203 /LENGTH=42 /DNA_ID=CAMNT_0017192133 /DNA_START=38 /DNA_END=162 /DNA_ORIENTATION=+
MESSSGSSSSVVSCMTLESSTPQNKDTSAVRWRGRSMPAAMP